MAYYEILCGIRVHLEGQSSVSVARLRTQSETGTSRTQAEVLRSLFLCIITDYCKLQHEAERIR
jgi:hypothetical protein